MSLRYYQSEAVAAGMSELLEGRSALLSIATGGGKAHINAEWCRQLLEMFPRSNILCLVHTKELVKQNASKLRLLMPRKRIGVYCAGLNQKTVEQITVANIKSVYKLPIFHRNFDLILVDECHLIPGKDVGQYKAFIAECKKHNPEIGLGGLTATPFRLDSGKIYGPGEIFPYICYKKSLVELISEGFLSPLTTKWGDDFDEKGINILGGEFNQGQVSERFSAIAHIEKHVEAILEKAKARKSILIFAVSATHAVLLTRAFKARGEICEFVISDSKLTSDKDRDAFIADFNTGKIRILVNVNVLSTGVDFPALDCLVILNPTKSKGRFMQWLGRGTRLSPGKVNCLVLDFGGNFERHGLIDQIEECEYATAKGKGGGKAPVKHCNNCSELIPISATVCPMCEHVLPAPDRKNESEAYRGAITSLDQPVSKLINISHTEYDWHVGKSGTPILKVTYIPEDLKLPEVVEWVGIEMKWKRAEAESWYLQHSRDSNLTRDAVPWTVEEVVSVSTSGGLKVPRSIEVIKDGKYFKVLDILFHDAEALALSQV